ncbi:MAG: pyrophosphate--fructose-6-phosphate 1-phosphotransferase, partial [Candidatus Marinimicrobia bacterium]|nr:pyrophosphate--fructose-6-phosphate 1-phosphotransferase [Candidatus Neomarinimicrobiota bacterium]
KGLNAERTLVQKSGYFARSAAPNSRDLALIKGSAMLAAESALAGENGVVGMDYEANDELRLIDFQRIRGGKEFDINQVWFKTLLKQIGQHTLSS